MRLRDGIELNVGNEKYLNALQQWLSQLLGVLLIRLSGKLLMMTNTYVSDTCAEHFSRWWCVNRTQTLVTSYRMGHDRSMQ